VNCVDCRAVFVGLSGSGRPRIRCFTCSPMQRKPGPRKTRRASVWSDLRPAHCPSCGSGFVAKLPLQRFCSRSCGLRENNRKKQEAARDRSPRPCQACGIAFAPAYGDQRSTICSEGCRRRLQSIRTSGKAHHRRAIRFGCAVVERFGRLEIFERDGWRCGICGQPTPRWLIGSNDPQRPTLDHIIPLSRGGEHSRRNAQCACWRCNIKKGAKLGMDHRLP
jgi:hypothetical protein